MWGTTSFWGRKNWPDFWWFKFNNCKINYWFHDLSFAEMWVMSSNVLKKFFTGWFTGMSNKSCLERWKIRHLARLQWHWQGCFPYFTIFAANDCFEGLKWTRIELSRLGPAYNAMWLSIMVKTATKWSKWFKTDFISTIFWLRIPFRSILVFPEKLQQSRENPNCWSHVFLQNTWLRRAHPIQVI